MPMFARGTQYMSCELFKLARSTLHQDHRGECTPRETYHVDVLDVVDDSVMVRLKLAPEAASKHRGRRTSHFDKLFIAVHAYRFGWGNVIY